jgi:hypothetical protein
LIRTPHRRGPWRSVHGGPGEGADRQGSPVAALLLAAALVLSGCGGDDESGTADEPAASVEASTDAGVTGEYATKVELLDSTCDGIEVADNETTVEQDGDSVTLIHAGISYVGPLGNDGSFATAPAEVTVGADTHALAVTGTFGDDGFEAQVVAAVTGSQTCGYTVRWTGSRE